MTRRSPFQRPSFRDRNQERIPRPRPTLSSEFRPRPTEVNVDEELSSSTDSRSSSFNANRFNTRPTSSNRSRLTPVPVTSEPQVTRPQRPLRPTPERVRTRPSNRIQFGRSTTEIPEIAETVPEVTEDSVLAGTESSFSVDREEIIESRVENEEISLQDRVLEEERVDIKDPIFRFTTAAPVEEESESSTSTTINFQDLFGPPSRSTPASRILESDTETLDTTSVTTTTSPVPIRTTPAPVRTTTAPIPTTQRRTTTSTTTDPPTRRTVGPVRVSTSVSLVTPASRPIPRVTAPPSSTRPKPNRGGGRQPRPRSSTYRPPSRIADYESDYFYDDNGALGGTLGELAELTEKALLLPDGKVQCYDTGYFAHPDSCKKFISCAKTVRGVVRGWVYTCPQQLVFDPVGGMCNWAEAVDCKAPII